MKRYLLALLTLCISALMTYAVVKTELTTPDLTEIASATADENSQYYYPRLLKHFMSNDTTMTDTDYQYFYYGTLFQEDYDPYRPSVNPALQKELIPIYAKEKRSRIERQKMLDYAMQALEDNPVDLQQLTNRIYVYEQNGKYDRAKIWQHKLNHLLLVIASSGNGQSAESAWIVVYPRHEYDFLNLYGMTATAQEFQPPFYDRITVTSKSGNTPTNYYFNIGEILNQYYLKHLSEQSK